MGKHLQSIDSRIYKRICKMGRGSVFLAIHFKDLGSPGAIRLSLMRQAQAGTIRQIARGLYDYPRKDKVLGALAPSVESVAEALAFRYAIRLQPSGGYAANLLGLSEQVPMKVVFLTDGRNRQVTLGKLQIIFKHTTPQNMATAGKTSGMVIQAIRYLGQRHVDEKVITHLRQKLSRSDKKQLLKDLRFAPAWVAAVMQQIAMP
jgi:hypothetical protein